MRRFFNKLAAGVMVATMAFTALAPVTTMAAGNDHTHSFTTATTTPSTSDKDCPGDSEAVRRAFSGGRGAVEVCRCA